ncbi:ABC transporter permease [Devosia sp. XJ19-1]|uniref:ABC transporter permease n=1 Tax=Devosia ureilytica TaxID=2952754 RepID=A0A9Q4AQJ4_9HYPH|nr:ABC transporter permease [Devosia ureilytica]MCP8884273.1 ABC transporter permease [Devosia ureilytica]MCP8887881.1 ABC transporter permease [Devosia ureilytica]
MNAILWRLVGWDVQLQARENIYAFTAMTTLAFAIFLSLLPPDAPPTVFTLVLFFDPAIVGASFVGSIVLMERSQNTLSALSVSPASARHYIIAKIITLTLLAIVGSLFLVAVAYWVPPIDMILRFTIALVFTGAVGVLGGLLIVAGANSMNHFIARAMPITIILFLPLLSHFGAVTGVWQWLLFAINPGHAMLRMMLWAADPTAVTLADIVYAFAYLAVAGVLLFRWAVGVYSSELSRVEE